MLNNLKNNLRYTNLHYAILKITNPRYLNWLKKEYFFHKKFLNNENLIFDLGANLGDKTYIFSKLSKKIICFEPEDKMYEILCRTFPKETFFKSNLLRLILPINLASEF